MNPIEIQNHIDNLTIIVVEEHRRLDEALQATKDDNPDVDFSRLDEAIAGIGSAVDAIPTSDDTTSTPPIEVDSPPIQVREGTNSGAGATITPNGEGDPAPAVDDGTLGQSHVDNGRPKSDALPTSYADMSAETDPPAGEVHTDGTVSPVSDPVDDGDGGDAGGEEHSDGSVSPPSDPVDSTSEDNDPGIEIETDDGTVIEGDPTTGEGTVDHSNEGEPIVTNAEPHVLEDEAGVVTLDNGDPLVEAEGGEPVTEVNGGV